jgi:hypothetical protein
VGLVVTVIIELISGLVIVGGLAVMFIIDAHLKDAAERAGVVSGPPRSPRHGSLNGRPCADRVGDRGASLPGASDPARSAEGRTGAPEAHAEQGAAQFPAHPFIPHGLLDIYEGPSDRDGFGGWCFWAQCTHGCISHDLPSRVEALAWVRLHADIENHLTAFSGGMS